MPGIPMHTFMAQDANKYRPVPWNRLPSNFQYAGVGVMGAAVHDDEAEAAEEQGKKKKREEE